MNQNMKRILELKNKHDGERIFIIGTGPSLLKTNFDLLKNEILFGVNTLYRGYQKFNIYCEYYAVSDPKMPYLQDLLNLDTQMFFGHGAMDNYISQLLNHEIEVKKVPLLLPLMGWMWQTPRNFSKDLVRGTFNGDTVIIDVCLQAAYYMGFDEVYLLGCDSDYSGQHSYNGMKTYNLQGNGVSGDWSKVFASYEICKKIFEESNRKIVNATVGGKLEIFERKSLEEII